MIIKVIIISSSPVLDIFQQKKKKKTISKTIKQIFLHSADVLSKWNVSLIKRNFFFFVWPLIIMPVFYSYNKSPKKKKRVQKKFKCPINHIKQFRPSYQLFQKNVARRNIQKIIRNK